MTEELPKAFRPYTKMDVAECIANIVGDEELLEWLVGKVMEYSNGKADPNKVKEMVTAPYMQVMMSTSLGMILDKEMREKYWGPDENIK